MNPALGWRAGFRLVAMALWLAVCVIAYFVAAPFPGRNRVPPVFLAGLGLIAGMEIETVGTPPRRAMLLSNHVSWMDIPALAATTRSAFVAHDGLQGHPALKRLCEMNDTVFIARSQRQTVAAQVEQLRAALADAHVLTLFPEGTTGPGDDLLPIKSSLLSAIDPPPDDVPIVPVLLSYEDVHQIAWVGAEPGVSNFLRILSRAEPVRLTVHFLPPLSGDELAGRKAMAMALDGRLSATMHASSLSNRAALA